MEAGRSEDKKGLKSYVLMLDMVQHTHAHTHTPVQEEWLWRAFVPFVIVAVFAEGVAGRRWGEVVERSERVGLSACALAWEKPDGLASGGRERDSKGGKGGKEKGVDGARKYAFR